MGWQTFAHDADIGVRGTGNSLEEAFAEAAVALTSVICDPGAVLAVEALEISCESPDPELLLVDWLNALIFEMATRRMLFSRYAVAIDADAGEGEGRYMLQATVCGEPVNVEKHRPAAEIKGATPCELGVGQDARGWFAQCVVDV